MKRAYDITSDKRHNAHPSGKRLRCIPSDIPVVVTRRRTSRMAAKTSRVHCIPSDIPVVVTHRRTSRLSIRVTKEGEVRVSAPWYVPKREINAFIDSHREWIEKALERVTQQQAGRNAFYDKLDISSPTLRKAAVARLDAIVTPLVERYSEQMGVSPAGISYRASKTRWGSCNTRTRRINFSLYLLLLPDWCIEHIVVHELAHLLEASHSPRFYAIMDRHFPRWRAARLETRRLSR